MKAARSCAWRQRNFIEHRIDWLATAGGRVGFTLPNSLIYGMGGIAWAAMQHVREQLPNGGQGVVVLPAGTFETVPGRFSTWYIGAGIEIRLDRSWTATIEYTYLPFKTTNTTPISQIISEPTWILHMLRVGVNYSFNAH